ncbi:hypothetical protein [Acinetobacter sp. ANC 3791]|uniref:hypothetical protein n=1 Tax=Acinetobacter sp. ANC 3791 TaxID=2529836 RepID=UPI00103943F7|nr:hypothetical protein [Acinetobacter sp. ANC 3791]TCB83400.1 hypothetical protein E0H90_11770 [Acinetobacter sp. ANC 3791]
MNYPSLGAGLAMLAAFAAYIDQGSNFATLIFYSDEKPASTKIAADSAKALVTLSLPKPCLKQTLSDGIELYATNSVIATSTGTATWARLYNGNGLAVIDLEMGVDIILNSYEIVAGGTQTLDSIILQPDLG